MDTLKAPFGLAILDLHALEDSANIGLDDRRRFRRRGSDTEKGMSENRYACRDRRTYLNNPFKNRGLKSLSDCGDGSTPCWPLDIFSVSVSVFEPSSSAFSASSFSSSVLPNGLSFVGLDAPKPVDGRRWRPIVPPVTLERRAAPVLLRLSCFTRAP